MKQEKKRLERERRTISVMTTMYCKANHGKADNLCADCRELLDYALQRVEDCPFGWRKPTCAKCPVHCYKPEMRERVRVMMRFSGPRMLLRHPVLAIQHLLDGSREAPRAKQGRG